MVIYFSFDFQDAVACYERIIQVSPNDVSHRKDFVKCLIDLGQLSTAVNVIDGTLRINAEWEVCCFHGRVITHLPPLFPFSSKY